MVASKGISIAILSAVSIALLSGCAELSALYIARDMKNTSDEYEQERHEERVEELDKEFEEYLSSQNEDSNNNEESEQSIVIEEDKR